MAKNRISAIPLTTFDSAAVTLTFQPINPDGLPHPCTILRVINGSTESISISYDGTTENDVLAAGDTLQINAQTNAQPANQFSLWPRGTVVYISGTAGTGGISVAGYYNPY